MKIFMVIFIIFFTHNLNAESKETNDSESNSDQQKTSITISPIHLAISMLEVTSEYNLSPNIGLALVTGFGQFKSETKDISGNVVSEDKYTAIEFGTHFKYYFFDNFEGLHFGGEILYLFVDRAGDDQGVKASGEGLAVGPFLGYKGMADIGFTWEIQAGYQFMLAKAEAEEDESGLTASTEQDASFPLINLNLGWSF